MKVLFKIPSLLLGVLAASSAVLALPLHSTSPPSPPRFSLPFFSTTSSSSSGTSILTANLLSHSFRPTIEDTNSSPDHLNHLAQHQRQASLSSSSPDLSSNATSRLQSRLISNIRGFNIGDKNPDGSCKTAQDWTNAFSDLRSLPNGGFNAVRLFSTSECDALARAVPAGIKAGVKFLVGIWSADDGHLAQEQAALVNAVKQHGHDWILAISVGNEDLYRHAIDPATLARRIRSVKTFLRAGGESGISLPSSILIGHADTWTAWQQPENAEVVRASDFVGHQGYPYWEGRPVEEGRAAFWQKLTNTVKGVTAATVNTGTPPVWVTETGWPVSGPPAGSSVASVDNAQAFWKATACLMFESYNVFWYAYQDYTSTPSFGVFDKNRKVLYDLSC